VIGVTDLLFTAEYQKKKKKTEFYMIFARKIFFSNFGGKCPPLPPGSSAYVGK